MPENNRRTARFVHNHAEQPIYASARSAESDAEIGKSVVRPAKPGQSVHMEWLNASVFLDNLVLHNILSTLSTDAKTLAAAAAVCKALGTAATEVASDSLLVLLKV